MKIVDFCFLILQKQRSMQPNAEERKRVFKPITLENDFTDIILPTPRKDRMPEILGSFVKETLNQEDAERFSPNTKIYEMMKSTNMSLSTSIESNQTDNELSSNICDVASSTKHLTNVNLTPKKSTDDIIVIPTSASRRSQRKTMHLTSYKEMSDDEDKASKNVSTKKTNNRRRTLLPLFTDTATSAPALDMSITNSLDNMNITNDIQTPPKSVAIKKTNRRKTVHSNSIMDMTASQANKTPENNLNKITSYLTKTVTPTTTTTTTTPPPAINHITDNNLFKTPTANKNKNDMTKQQSTGRKKISPLIKSVLRRRTMLAVESPMQLNNTTNNKQTLPTDTVATPSKSVRRRTLFTPNKMVEISKTMEIDSRNQVNDMDVSITSYESTVEGKLKYFNGLLMIFKLCVLLTMLLLQIIDQCTNMSSNNKFTN